MAETTDAQKAKIVMYRGLNYDGGEIAEAVGVSKSTVYTYLNRFEDQAKAAESPISDVYAPLVLGAVFDSGFRSDAASMMFGHVE